MSKALAVDVKKSFMFCSLSFIQDTQPVRVCFKLLVHFRPCLQFTAGFTALVWVASKENCSNLSCIFVVGLKKKVTVTAHIQGVVIHTPSPVSAWLNGWWKQIKFSCIHKCLWEKISNWTGHSGYKSVNVWMQAALQVPVTNTEWLHTT